MKKLLFLLSFLPFCSQAQIIVTVAGGGSATPNGVPATSANIGVPYAIALYNNGDLIIADDYGRKIYKVNPAYNGTITTIAGTGLSGYSGDGGPATNAGIDFLQLICTDENDNIYIADGYRLRKIATSGIIHTIAGTGIAGYNGDGIPATSAQVNVVSGMAVDDTGNVYFVDAGNLRIRKIDTSGIIHTIAGTGISGYSPDGSQADTAQFSLISMLSIDRFNDLYFLDNARFRKINHTTGFITTIAGTGIWGYSGDGGPATSAQIRGGGIVVDTSGYIYLADGGNNRVRMINLEGNITTIAGTGMLGSSGDWGHPLLANIESARSLVLNKDGDIFVTSGDRVRMITNKPLTNITTIESSNLLKISPNPSLGLVNINVATPLEEHISLVITNTEGKQMFRCTHFSNQSIPVYTPWPTGTYIAIVAIGQQQWVQKFLVQ
jgi:hypothetical protein